MPVAYINTLHKLKDEILKVPSVSAKYHFVGKDRQARGLQCHGAHIVLRRGGAQRPFCIMA